MRRTGWVEVRRERKREVIRRIKAERGRNRHKARKTNQEKKRTGNVGIRNKTNGVSERKRCRKAVDKMEGD